MTATGSTIMPFGKYKGNLLEDIVDDDPDYVDWMLGQEWFQEYEDLYEYFETEMNRRKESKGEYVPPEKRRS